MRSSLMTPFCACAKSCQLAQIQVPRSFLPFPKACFSFGQLSCPIVDDNLLLVRLFPFFDCTPVIPLPDIVIKYRINPHQSLQKLFVTDFASPFGQSPLVITTSAPALWQASAMRLSSVATTRASRLSAFFACSQVLTTIGLPRMSTSGFPGNLCDSYLAGITPSCTAHSQLIKAERTNLCLSPRASSALKAAEKLQDPGYAHHSPSCFLFRRCSSLSKQHCCSSGKSKCGQNYQSQRQAVGLTRFISRHPCLSSPARPAG